MNSDIEKPYSGGFRDKTHYFALRVYIEDTDLGGVVYHANYLRFLERARSDMLRSAGIDQRAGIDNRVGVYAVVEAQIKYRKPAKLDDELVVVSRLEGIHGASCVISQKILRGADLVTEAVVTVAFVGPDGRPKRQPAEWVGKFEKILNANERE
jgi:acyl-CoA thioester hydrolase